MFVCKCHHRHSYRYSATSMWASSLSEYFQEFCMKYMIFTCLASFIGLLRLNYVYEKLSLFYEFESMHGCHRSEKSVGISVLSQGKLKFLKEVREREF